MGAALGLDCLRRRELDALRIIGTFRRCRESYAEREVDDFEPKLFWEVAGLLGVQEARVREVVEELIELRPLRALSACRHKGVAEIFEVVPSTGRKIGILSDYPIAGKLNALGLETDFAVSTTDPGIGVLKPHPRGLQKLMQLAGEGPQSTLMIGDRDERDGEVARRAGASALIIGAGKMGRAFFQGLCFPRPNLANGRCRIGPSRRRLLPGYRSRGPSASFARRRDLAGRGRVPALPSGRGKRCRHQPAHLCAAPRIGVSHGPRQGNWLHRRSGLLLLRQPELYVQARGGRMTQDPVLLSAVSREPHPQRLRQRSRPAPPRQPFGTGPRDWLVRRDRLLRQRQFRRHEAAGLPRADEDASVS